MKTLTEISNHYGMKKAVNRGTGFNNTGGDMNEHGYTALYDKHFKDLRSSNITFLEIGVFQGRKLATFSDYFSNGELYGIDLSVKEFELMKPELEKNGAFSNKNLKLVCGGASDVKDTWDEKILSYPDFDVIIDDGCHRPNAWQPTIENFWPKLKDGGIYVIEDIHDLFIDELNERLITTGHDKYIINTYKTTIDESIMFLIK